MKVEQIYTGCLAEAAYYIESNGEVAIIDPLRETDPYIDRANEDGAKIKYVLETHFHADFVSGHIDLARKTGATIVYGPTAKPNFDAHIAEDGEILPLGNVKIKVLHTPGHTMESVTFLLLDEDGKEHSIYTGDALFIGDVGRPDLAVKTDLTQEDLASHLFDSLRNKIMPLPDHVIVYPGHGKGSACGKMMSDDRWATLGNQKQFNYALRADMTREEFIETLLDGLVEPPQYFPKNAVLNKMGYDSMESVLEKGLTPLSLKDFMNKVEFDEALIIDTRHKEEVPKGFIPGSIFIGIDDNFAMWVGALITDLQQPIVFIADKGREEEVVVRLARVGYDNPLGYLEGGFETWINSGKEADTIDQITAFEFAKKYGKNLSEVNILDVRKQSEFDSEHVVGAINFPLDFINRNMSHIDPNKKYFIHCQGGYRALIAASILRARGFNKLVDIENGFSALMEEPGIHRTAYVAPTTML